MKNSPKLKQKLEVKKYHGYEIKDEFSWVHQKDILSVLKDSSKLNPEVRKYSGNIIYVDNRPSITRSTNQKEDIKVILQF